MKHILSFNSPWTSDIGTVRLLAPPTELRVDEIIEQLRNDALGQPYIFETRNERRLHFDRRSVQSAMDILRPNDLILPYTKKMMCFLLFNPHPSSIFMVGLGGGSLAKFCYHHLRKTTIVVTETDKAIISLRQEFCVPKDNKRFRVINEDGAHLITQEDKLYDVILVDAFDPCGIDHSLTDSGFYAAAAIRLAKSGVMVMNLSGEKTRFAAHIDQVKKAFKGSIFLMSVGDGNNLVLFAFNEEVSLHGTVCYMSRAQDLRRTFMLDFPYFLSRLTEAEVLQ